MNTYRDVKKLLKKRNLHTTTLVVDLSPPPCSARQIIHRGTEELGIASRKQSQHSRNRVRFEEGLRLPYVMGDMTNPCQT